MAKDKIPEGKFCVQAGEDLDLPGEVFDYVVVSETVNLAADVQRSFKSVKSVSHANTRLIVNIYSSLWRPAIWLATVLGYRNRHPVSNWLSKEDIAGLMHLTGWELIRHECGPVLITKSKRRAASILSLQVRSQGFPAFSTSEDLPDVTEIVKPVSRPE